MKKLTLALMAALLLIAPGCGGRQDAATGTVELVAGGERHAALPNWIFSLDESGLAADGERKAPQDVADELAAIPFGEDARLDITGRTTGTQTYTLYDSGFEQVFSGGALLLPQGPGEYILCIELAWGSDRAYEGYQYFFKIEV